MLRYNANLLKGGGLAKKLPKIRPKTAKTRFKSILLDNVFENNK